VHAVVALALPAVEAFDLAIPAQVFGDPGLPERYSFTVCAPAPGLVPCTTGYALHTGHGLEAPSPTPKPGTKGQGLIASPNCRNCLGPGRTSKHHGPRLT
jgi:hypothetical protein